MSIARINYKIDNQSNPMYLALRKSLREAGCTCPDSIPIFSDAAFMLDFDNTVICSPLTGQYRIAGICKRCRKIGYIWCDLDDPYLNVKMFNESYAKKIRKEFFEEAASRTRNYARCDHHIGLSDMVSARDRESKVRYDDQYRSGLYFRHLVGCFKCKFTMEWEVPQDYLKNFPTWKTWNFK